MNDAQARDAAFQDFWRSASRAPTNIRPGTMPPEGTGFGDYWREHRAEMGPPVGPAYYVAAPAGQDTTVYWAFVEDVYAYRPGEGVVRA